MSEEKKVLERYIISLYNPAISDWDTFAWYVDQLEMSFSNATKKLKEKTTLLEDIEKNRLNEALNCYVNGCNYSTIIMAVSAIEHRLLSLMKTSSHNKKLDRLTLGDLIRRYLENKDEYGNIIPKRHLPLLEYCNTYRVLSAHPKAEEITRSNATSILCMTCSFLFDKKLKTKIEKSKS